MNKPDLSIVLPCYNESGNIPVIVDRLKNFSEHINFELVLVNNGSTDNSAVVMNGLAEKYQFVKIVTVQKNIGYGHGILTGLNAAKADILGYSHADIQAPPEDIIKAYKIITEKKYDIEKVLIKGLRVNRKQEQLFLTRALAKVVEIILGRPMEDINGQPKVFSRKLLENLKFPPDDFSFDVYIMYIAGLMDLELVTFPVDFGERAYGESKWASNIFKKNKTILSYLLSICKIAKAHYDAPENMLRHITRFLVTGLFTNAINYFVFIILLRLFNIYYLLSSVSGFLAGFAVGFIFNRSWTFTAAAGDRKKQLFRFFIVNIISLLVNLFTVWISTDILNVIPELSQVVAMAISTVINFTGSKYWAFNKK